MIRFVKKFKIIFSVLLFLFICIVCQKSYAFAARRDTVSYGIAIFLIIWQWFQYIFPILLTLILIIKNRKKLNYKKIIIYILIITFGVCYLAGMFMLNYNLYSPFSSGRMDIIEFNGMTLYVHK